MNKFTCLALFLATGACAFAAPIDGLDSPDQATREAAAKILRATYKPAPRAKWAPLLLVVDLGMSKAEIVKALSPYHVKADGWASWGGAGPVWYRLDECWQLECDMDFVKDRLLNVDLVKKFVNFQVEPPPHFTGVWIDYYANGQPSAKTGYKDGTMFGDYVTYYSDGTVQQMRRYDLRGAQGQSTDYYASGKLASRVYFKDSQPAGIWTWYNKDGSVNSTENHTTPPLR